MALNVLLVEEMVSVSGPMIDPAHWENEALRAVAAAAPLLPALERAHAELVASQLPALSPERKSAIASELGELDGRHDDAIRAVFHGLTGAYYLAPTGDARARIQALLDRLLPDGLSATVQTYRVQAGQAALLASRLTAADLDALATISVAGTTLRDAVQEWIALGGQIGALEDERTPGPVEVTADALAARSQWIRTMRALAMVLELVAGDNPQIVRILARLAAIERKATTRSAARRSLAADDTADPDGDGAADPDGPADDTAPPPSAESAEPAGPSYPAGTSGTDGSTPGDDGDQSVTSTTSAA